MASFYIIFLYHKEKYDYLNIHYPLLINTDVYYLNKLIELKIGIKLNIKYFKPVLIHILTFEDF